MELSAAYLFLNVHSKRFVIGRQTSRIILEKFECQSGVLCPIAPMLNGITNAGDYSRDNLIVTC